MFKDMVLKTRSYRRFYEDAAIGLETLRELVDLARLSASARNMQPLKYVLCCNRETNAAVFSTLAWAGYLTDWPGPVEGERPSGYIVVLGDNTLSQSFGIDHGIAMQSILLGATEKGLGGCMIGSIQRERLREILAIPERYEILNVVALGKPKETVVPDPVGPDGNIKYWRDAAAVHHVPKRALQDIIVAESYPDISGRRVHMSDQAGDYAEYRFTAEFYDHLIPYSTRGDVAFFVEMAQASGGPVLEVGCGTGRVLIPTARAGIEIVGLDLSPFMLSICRGNLAQEPPEVQARVRVVEGDMRSFDLGREFTLITLPFRPFQHLTTVEDQMTCLRILHRHLAPGGRLVLDLFNPSIIYLAAPQRMEEYEDIPQFTMPDGRRVARNARITARDYFNQIQDVDLIYYVTHPDGREERLVHSFPMRYLFRFEAEHLLARCGFAIEVLYGDYDKSLYGSKYPGELIFVATKT